MVPLRVCICVATFVEAAYRVCRCTEFERLRMEFAIRIGNSLATTAHAQQLNRCTSARTTHGYKYKGNFLPRHTAGSQSGCTRQKPSQNVRRTAVPQHNMLFSSWRAPQRLSCVDTRPGVCAAGNRAQVVLLVLRSTHLTVASYQSSATAKFQMFTLTTTECFTRAHLSKQRVSPVAACAQAHASLSSLSPSCCG